MKSGVYEMPFQKDQIEMMKRIQNEMRNSLKEKVKELEATKIMIEEENEKLQERILQLVAAERAHRGTRSLPSLSGSQKNVVSTLNFVVSYFLHIILVLQSF